MNHYVRIILFIFLLPYYGISQELYAATEPASNMAANSVGFRIDHSLMAETNKPKIDYHLIPELMIGVSKKYMLHANMFLSNRTERFRMEGGSLYGKYRFFTRDAMQRHFRMAIFARISYNNSDIHQEEISMCGHNTGYEAGVVATQLIRKVALSSAIGFVKARDNGNNNKFIYGDENSKAVNYSFSVGKLMLPKEYSSYRQTNVNLMLEFLSQVNTGSGKYYADIAPSIQMIFNSEARIDIGYKKQLTSTMLRTAPNGIFIRLEYNFFNAF